MNFQINVGSCFNPGSLLDKVYDPKCIMRPMVIVTMNSIFCFTFAVKARRQEIN